MPEATSSSVAGLPPANGAYLASTAAMGSLFRSAEGAHCILDSQAGSQVSSTRRNAAGGARRVVATLRGPRVLGRPEPVRVWAFCWRSDRQTNNLEE